MWTNHKKLCMIYQSSLLCFLRHCRKNLREVSILTDYVIVIGCAVLALILALVSTGFMIPVLMEFAKTGLVPRFPTLIACCVTMLAALLLFIAGLILSTLQEKDKRDFEFELQQVSDQYRRLTTEEAARQEKVSA